jgi:hypothetical protein
MSDIKRRKVFVRERLFGKYSDFEARKSAEDALKRAREFFRTEDDRLVALAMAEVLFGSGKKGFKFWTDDRHLRLAFAYEHLRLLHPEMSREKIAELLGKQAEFRGATENIRQRLSGGAKREYGRWWEYQIEDSWNDGPEDDTEEDPGFDD